MLLPSSSTETTLAKRASLPLLTTIDLNSNSDSGSDSNTAADSFIHNPVRQTRKQKQLTLKAAKEMQKQKG